MYNIHENIVIHFKTIHTIKKIKYSPSFGCSTFNYNNWKQQQQQKPWKETTTIKTAQTLLKMKIYIQYSRKHRKSFHIYLNPSHKTRNLSSTKLQENEIQESLVSYNPQETLRKFSYEPKLTYKTVLQDLQRNTFDRGWDVISPTMQWSAFERPSYSPSFQIRNTYFTRKIILRYLFWYVLYTIWSILQERIEWKISQLSFIHFILKDILSSLPYI